MKNGRYIGRMNQEPAHAGYWAEYLLCGVTSPWFLEPHVGSVYLPNLEVVFRRGVHLGMSAPIFWRSNLPQLLSLEGFSCISVLVGTVVSLELLV